MIVSILLIPRTRLSDCKRILTRVSCFVAVVRGLGVGGLAIPVKNPPPRTLVKGSPTPRTAEDVVNVLLARFFSALQLQQTRVVKSSVPCQFLGTPP